MRSRAKRSKMSLSFISLDAKSTPLAKENIYLKEACSIEFSLPGIIIYASALNICQKMMIEYQITGHFSNPEKSWMLTR